MLNKDYSLWKACENGDTNLVREYLKMGASPNAKHHGVFKWTGMHLAAINDQAPTLELLHEYGAQFDLRDASGRTPIRLARKHLRMEAARALEAMMGYEDGDGSDTDVELGDDMPNELQEHLGFNSTSDPRAEQLPQNYSHPFWKELEETLANNTSTLGFSESKAQQHLNQSQYDDRECRRKANKEASEKRRMAACEYAPAEIKDSEGFTPSQRKHLNRLIHASKVNAETGIPMEQVLGDEKYEPPPGGYDLPRCKKTANEEGPDAHEEAQGRETGEGYFENPIPPFENTQDY